MAKIKKKIPELIKLVQAYKPPPIDWSCQNIISHSQMTIFNGCNYRWGLRYRDKIKLPDPSIHLIFGIAIHESIQSYVTTYYEQSKVAADRLDLVMTFRQKLKSLYVEQYILNNKEHFSTPEELDEFCMDGIDILRYFKSKVAKYFSKKGWCLVGCEVPISHSILPNVFYNGFLDIVMYHEPTNTVEIIDLKTSTKSWYDTAKKDEGKLSQLLLYKKLFANQFDFPIKNIEVKFIILKRKIKEDGDFPEKRIQEFVPASGNGKIDKAYKMLELFAHSTFDKHGNIIKDKFKKTINPKSCHFCPYKEREDLCSKATPFKKQPNPFEIF